MPLRDLLSQCSPRLSDMNPAQIPKARTALTCGPDRPVVQTIYLQYNNSRIRTYRPKTSTCQTHPNIMFLRFRIFTTCQHRTSCLFFINPPVINHFFPRSENRLKTQNLPKPLIQPLIFNFGVPRSLVERFFWFPRYNITLFFNLSHLRLFSLLYSYSFGKSSRNPDPVAFFFFSGAGLASSKLGSD